MCLFLSKVAANGSARITLLVHILCKVGKTANDLKDVADNHKRKFSSPRKGQGLDEILKVRMLEERFESGEVGISNLDPPLDIDTDNAQTRQPLSISITTSA